MYNFDKEEILLNEIKELVTNFMNRECPNAKFREEHEDKRGSNELDELAIKEVCSICPLNKNVFMLAVETGDYSHVPLCDVLQIEFNVDED